MAYGTNFGQPMGGYDPRQILAAPDAATREALMRRIGVANIDPPLPHSPCLKIKRDGRVLPWNELLAQQRDLCECCDENGNTDPAAWEPKVVDNTLTNAELECMARQQLFIKNDTAKTDYEHKVPNPQLNKGPSEYEKQGVISFSDIRKLREALNESK